ncbi:hypothetical protein G6F37_000951 [Rhizopus arrhizus]|nr:hypothetical protein G6F38_003243 [Rhizopus arrhizus]KAG1163726.1 hypothetical protein G6F37_000951 [Rhizopus arrhizus]
MFTGANTIRIANKLNNYPAQYSCKKLSVEEKINQGDPPISPQQSGTRPSSPELLLSNSQQQESLLNLKQEIEAQVEETKKHLKDAHNERKGEILAKNDNKLKAKWISPSTAYISKATNVTQNKTRGNTEIYDQIKIAKTKKSALNKSVQDAKSQLRMLQHRKADVVLKFNERFTFIPCLLFA